MGRLLRDSGPGASAALFLLFFLSGFCALTYEVLWERRLSLILGHSVLSMSTILSMTMGGLAVGSLAGGHRVDSGKGVPLLDYARLEAFIGLWGWLSWVLLLGLEKSFYALAEHGVEGRLLQSIGSVWALVVLLPATVAMGATLPVVTGTHREGDGNWGVLVARLYGWNTLGGVAGALAGGFLLLPVLGGWGSLLLAGALNLLVAVAARRLSSASAAESGPPPEDGSPLPVPGGRHPLAVAFLLGVASMACQVCWSRGLVLSLGSSTYAFSSIVTVFLAGVSAGGLAYARLGRGRADWSLTTGVVGMAALGVLYSLFAVGRLPGWFLLGFSRLGADFGAVLALQFVLTALVVGPATMAFGAALPILAARFHREQASGRRLGQLLALNTLGCIVGAWGAGFVGIPLLGNGSTLLLAAGLACVATLVCSQQWLGYRRGLALVMPLTGVAFWLAPQWPRDLLTAGVAVYGQDYLQDKQPLALRVGHPAFYRDGISSTVSVHFSGSYLTLKVNGKVDASLHPADRQTMYLTGYLGALACTHPKTAAVVGLGSGMTLQALSHFEGMESIECAEIEPAVVEAQKYWKPHNAGIIDDPRVRVRSMDGRRFLMANSRRYDVIASEPSNPWIAGVGNLYTQEFYRACREHLTEGGVMAQWFHLYSVSDREIGIVVRTFYSVFPEGQVWVTAPGDLVLLGSSGPIKFDLQRVRALYESSSEVRQIWFDLDLFRPEALLGHYLMERQSMLDAFPGREVNTDDLPMLEFLAPRHLYDYSARQNLDHLYLDRSGFLPPGAMESEDLILEAAEGWLNTGNLTDLRRLLARTSGPGSRLLWARLLVATNAPGKHMMSAFARAAETGAPTGPIDFLRGELFIRLGLWKGALSSFKRASVSPWPGGEGQIDYACGLAALNLRDYPTAQQSFERACRLLPGSAAWVGLGRAQLAQGKESEGLKAFQTALQRNPFDVDAHLGLGLHYLAKDEFQRAQDCFSAVLEVMPEHQIALLNLGVCQANTGARDLARETFQKLLRYHPDDPSAQKNLQTLNP